MEYSAQAQLIITYLKNLQTTICNGLEMVDGSTKFRHDDWQRPAGGGGQTRVLADGAVFEKGGVNFSAINGEIPPFLQKEIQEHFPQMPASTHFLATGISIVIHPQSPLVPIIHMNIRYFETNNGAYWFGGGIDLTPHYVMHDDANYFHNQLKNVCDKLSAETYNNYKNWADDYFYIKHRNETRGIGGIFFDKLWANETHTIHNIMEFWQNIGNTFLPTYTQLVNKNKTKNYTAEQKRFQLLRRGRYVEFNLVYDRGTKFGLETDGRIESILMSLPKHVSWEYDANSTLGTEELATLALLKKGVNWLGN
ncbi:MAG: oxygen-dependent coproporphyrinogen oxidase [Bacteroidia bacterium]|nr:oxygen-dependent coproporphyrinogen oxidase [Bacteroidia bacterium]